MAIHQSRRAVILAIIAFAYILLLPFHWPPQSDAAHYVYASQSLLAGSGWQLDPASYYWGTTVYAEWTPLQPLVLAVIQLSGVDAYTAARLLNAGCFALTAVLVWGTLPTGRKWLVLPLFTPFYTLVYQMVWSEPLFNLLVVIFLLLLTRDPLPLAALSIVAALIWLQRYTGMYVVGFGAVYILARYGARYALFFALLPTVCMGAWVLRNLDLVGLPFGMRPPPKVTWAQNIEWALATLAIWGGVIGVAWCINRAFSWLSSSAISYLSSLAQARAE
jgi:hypothetical protein